MAKTNFTKVEEELEKGLRKINVGYLLSLCDAESSEIEKHKKIQQTILYTLKLELKSLYKQDKTLYKKLGIKRKSLQELLDPATPRSKEEWQRIKKVYGKVKNIKKELEKERPESADEDLVNLERIKHINKRFNVNEKWLPLQ